jgi:hypothetical protein
MSEPTPTEELNRLVEALSRGRLTGTANSNNGQSSSSTFVPGDARRQVAGMFAARPPVTVHLASGARGLLDVNFHGEGIVQIGDTFLLLESSTSPSDDSAGSEDAPLSFRLVPKETPEGARLGFKFLAPSSVTPEVRERLERSRLDIPAAAEGIGRASPKAPAPDVVRIPARPGETTTAGQGYFVFPFRGALSFEENLEALVDFVTRQPGQRAEDREWEGQGFDMGWFDVVAERRDSGATEPNRAAVKNT